MCIIQYCENNILYEKEQQQNCFSYIVKTKIV